MPRQSRILLLFSLAWMAMCALPFARAAQPAPTGVWQGTVGNAAVRVCFSVGGDGQYYYLRHKRGIHLALRGDRDTREAHGAWDLAWEDGQAELEEWAGPTRDATPLGSLWRLKRESATRLTGTWAAAAEGRSTAVTLTKTAARAGQDEGQLGGRCSPAYLAPIRDAVRPTSSPTDFQGRAFQALGSGQAASFAVPPGTPNADRLNRHAMEWLRDQAVVAFECDLGRGGPPVPLDSWLRPVVWTDSLLVMEDLMPEADCGGAHGNSSQSFTTWSLKEGRVVDTWAWLRGGKEKAWSIQKDEDGRPAPSGLFKLLAEAHSRNVAGDDCSEYVAVERMGIDAPYPTAEGLVFNTRFFHAMRACNEEVTLGWKQMAPYLSPQGRAVMDGW